METFGYTGEDKLVACVCKTQGSIINYCIFILGVLLVVVCGIHVVSWELTYAHGGPGVGECEWIILLTADGIQKYCLRLKKQYEQ